jgi:hypothetical protein
MKFFIFNLLVIFIIMVLSACQPQTTVKSGDSTQVDSSFYYVQEDISDPFIDTVFQEPDDKVTLQKELYPPAAPGVLFREVEGFRVQIFAGLDTINADMTSTEAGGLVSDSVYLFDEKGLMKVQVGDYQFRPQADNMRDFLKTKGYTGAWVVQRMINIPVDTSQVYETLPQVVNDPGTQVEKTSASGKYKIQIMATGSEDRARAVSAEIKGLLGYEAFYEQSGTLYKVFVGYFIEEIDARQALTQVRENGYPDAWLVY